MEVFQSVKFSLCKHEALPQSDPQNPCEKSALGTHTYNPISKQAEAEERLHGSLPPAQTNQGVDYQSSIITNDHGGNNTD